MTNDTGAPEPRKLVLLVCKAAYNKQAQRVAAYYSRQNGSNVVVTCNGPDTVTQFLRTFRYKYTGKACCWFCDVYIHYIGSGADVVRTQQSPLAVKLDAGTLDLWQDVCMEVCKYQRPLLVLDCTMSADISRRLEHHMATSLSRGLPLVLSANGLTSSGVDRASQSTLPSEVTPPVEPDVEHPHPEHVGVLSRMVARQKPFQQWHAHHAVVVGSTNAVFKPKDDADVLRLLGVALFAGCAYIRATNPTSPTTPTTPTTPTPNTTPIPRTTNPTPDPTPTPCGPGTTTPTPTPNATTPNPETTTATPPHDGSTPPHAGPTILFTKTSHLKHARTPTSAAPLLPQHHLGPSPFTVHRMHAALPVTPQRLPALDLYRDWVAAGRQLVPFLQRTITTFNDAVTRLQVQATPTDLSTPATRAAFTARFTTAAPVLSRLPTLLLALSHPPALPLAPAAFTAFSTLLLRLLGLPDCLPHALAPLASLDLRRLLTLPPAPPPAAPSTPPTPPPTQCLLALALCLLLWLDPLPAFDVLANLAQVPPDFLQFVLAFVHGGVPLPEVLSQLNGIPGAPRVASIMQHVYARRIVRAELARNLGAEERAALKGVLPYHVVPEGIPVCQYGNLVGHYQRAVRHALRESATAVAAGGDGAA